MIRVPSGIAATWIAADHREEHTSGTCHISTDEQLGAHGTQDDLAFPYTLSASLAGRLEQTA